VDLYFLTNMKHKLDIDTWNRKEHFNFFKSFDAPYYGVTIKLDCTHAYSNAKLLGVSFYSYYLHKILAAVNAIPNFRYRIEGNDVFEYDRIDASTTVLRDDHTFGFSNMKFVEDVKEFDAIVKAETKRVKNLAGLLTAPNAINAIHFSALPWIDFTSISESSDSRSGDSCAKISVGKLADEDGKKLMPFAVHVHHALVDGYHLGLFLNKLKELMNK
jgi:chloramphenicol O-acetyltransferase type A